MSICKVIQVLVLVFAISACKEHEAKTPLIKQGSVAIVKKNTTYPVTVKSGINYAEALSHKHWNSLVSSRVKLKLDAYIPKNNFINRPVILLIHGGGFRGGTRKDKNIVGLSKYYASRGWVVFSIDYRLKRDKGTIPQEWITYANTNDGIPNPETLYQVYPAIRDAKAALRWVVANAASYNINTDYITVGGGSAGAIIATTLGVSNIEDYTTEISSSSDPTLKTTNLEETYRIKTILNFWGSGDGIDALNEIYGYQRLDKENAPILIVHGTNDTILPLAKAKELKEAYIKNKVNYSYYPLTDLGHGPWQATIDGKKLNKLAFDFIIAQQNLTVE